VTALVAAIILAGYTLLYAAVANGGKLAAQPWQAFRINAYDIGNGPNGASTPGPASVATPTGGILSTLWKRLLTGLAFPAGGGLVP
jgi:hypothetical protein